MLTKARKQKRKYNSLGALDPEGSCGDDEMGAGDHKEEEEKERAATQRNAKSPNLMIALWFITLTCGLGALWIHKVSETCRDGCKVWWTHSLHVSGPDATSTSHVQNVEEEEASKDESPRVVADTAAQAHGHPTAGAASTSTSGTRGRPGSWRSATARLRHPHQPSQDATPRPLPSSITKPSAPPPKLPPKPPPEPSPRPPPKPSPPTQPSPPAQPHRQQATPHDTPTQTLPRTPVSASCPTRSDFVCTEGVPVCSCAHNATRINPAKIKPCELSDTNPLYGDLPTEAATDGGTGLDWPLSPPGMWSCMSTKPKSQSSPLVWSACTKGRDAAAGASPGLCQFTPKCGSVCKEDPILFLGDSTSRIIYQGFVDLEVQGGRVANILGNKDRDALFTAGTIMYQYRARLWQNACAFSKHCGVPNSNQAIVDNLVSNKSPQERSKAWMVMSVGPHEVMGKKHYSPSWNIEEAQDDLNQFQAHLCRIGFMGRLIWWIPHALKGHRFRVGSKHEKYFHSMRRLHALSMRRFGAVVLDFFSTTDDRMDLMDYKGIHYNDLRTLHATMLSHTFGQMQANDSMGRITCDGKRMGTESEVASPTSQGSKSPASPTLSMGGMRGSANETTSQAEGRCAWSWMKDQCHPPGVCYFYTGIGCRDSPPPNVEETIEEIVEERTSPTGSKEYLVRWIAYPHYHDASWLPLSHIETAADVIAAFDRRRAHKS